MTREFQALISSRRLRRANITRYAHVGESIGAMEISGSFGDAQTAITPSSVARNRFFISRD